jgi:hypothetical protein
VRIDSQQREDRRGDDLHAGATQLTQFLELVDHPLRVVFLAAEHRHDSLRIAFFQLGCVLHAEFAIECDALAQGQQRAARVIEVGAEEARASIASVNERNLMTSS